MPADRKPPPLPSEVWVLFALGPKSPNEPDVLAWHPEFVADNRWAAEDHGHEEYPRARTVVIRCEPKP